MKITGFLALAALALFPTAVAGQTGQTQTPSGEHSTAPERVEILSVLHRYYEDFSNLAWDEFANHFWEGATITTVWQAPGEEKTRVVVTAIPDFIRQAGDGPGSKSIFEETMGSAKVLVYQNLAVVWAEYDAKFGEPGTVREWSGIDAFTLMKHDGDWKIVSLAFAASQ